MPVHLMELLVENSVFGEAVEAVEAKDPSFSCGNHSLLCASTTISSKSIRCLTGIAMSTLQQ